jgi:hypothetical protein
MHRADNLTTFMCRLSRNLGASTSWNSQGLSRPVQEMLYLYIFCLVWRDLYLCMYCLCESITEILGLMILVFFLLYKFLSSANMNVFACGMITENNIGPWIETCALPVSFLYKNKSFHSIKNFCCRSTLFNRRNCFRNNKRNCFRNNKWLESWIFYTFLATRMNLNIICIRYIEYYR